MLRFEEMVMEIKDTRWFINERKEQFDCAKDITGEGNVIVCPAPVKSGKREIVICASLLKDKKSKHIYAVNLRLIDTKEQIEELNAYGISTYVGRDLRSKLENIKREIEEAMKNDITIYLHVDELDYGSGAKQCFADFLRFTIKLPVVHIFYSATAFELLYAQGIQFRVCNFKPHSSYKGTEYFLNNGLVHQAEEGFFHYNSKGILELSPQGEECCRLINVKQGKHIGVVRITTMENKQSVYQNVKANFGQAKSSVKRSLDKIFGKDNYVIKFTDKDSSLFWGDREKNSSSRTAWYDLPFNKPVLHIINQTSSRSTEWAIQPYLAFYHSYRKESSITTILQYDTRSFGYRECTCHIYTSDVEIFAIPAKDEEYFFELMFRKGWKISPRVKSIGGIGESGRAKPGSYELVFLFEDETPGLEIYEKDHPIHQQRKIRETPSIRYNGHHYPWCNRTSTWGVESEKSTSNLARFMFNQIMSFSKSHEITFGWIDFPSIERKDWKVDFDNLCSLDPRIQKAFDDNRRVFAIFRLKSKSNIVTKDNSIYHDLVISEADLFTE